MMNIQKNQEYNYQVGNYLTENHPTYVRRPVDKQFFNALKAGEYCYVLSSPQTGKSSLKVSTIKLLQEENIICIVLDMTRVNNQLLTLDEWYDQVILTLEKSFIFPRHFPELWWEERADMIPDEKLFMFIEEVLLANTHNKKIVIFIDAVDDDSVINSGWESLGILINYCFQERTNNPDFKRLTFALLGMTIPNHLVDICRYIEVSSFKIEEVAHFVNRLEGIVKQPLKVMEEILFWSGGQPFLTQKLCQIVINYLDKKGVEESYNAVALVEDLVKICVVENWDAQDYPAHFSKIKNLLLRNIQKSTSHLELYQQLLKHGRLKPPSENNQKFKNDAIANSKWEIKELLRSGVAKINQGFLEVYSPIYAEIFNQEWVEKYIGEITQSVPIVDKQNLELNESNSQVEENIHNLNSLENHKNSSNSVINPQQEQQEQQENPLYLNKLNSQEQSWQIESNISYLEIPENHKNSSNSVINPPQKQLKNSLYLNDFNSQKQSFQIGANISYLEIPENHKIFSNSVIKQQQIEISNNQVSHKKVKISPKHQNKIKTRVAGLAIVSVLAITGFAWATKLFQDKQNQLQTTEYQLQKVKYELQETQTGTKLERQGINALKQFEVAEIKALLSAMQAGKELQELIKDDYRSLKKTRVPFNFCLVITF